VFHENIYFGATVVVVVVVVVALLPRAMYAVYNTFVCVMHRRGGKAPNFRAVSAHAPSRPYRICHPVRPWCVSLPPPTAHACTIAPPTDRPPRPAPPRCTVIASSIHHSRRCTPTSTYTRVHSSAAAKSAPPASAHGHHRTREHARTYISPASGAAFSPPPPPTAVPVHVARTMRVRVYICTYVCVCVCVCVKRTAGWRVVGDQWARRRGRVAAAALSNKHCGAA